ncbi:MAG: SseB family protein [Actinomycetes bacterium]
MSNEDRFSDSAGVSWSGREFVENQFADDDGSASAELTLAIASFRSGDGTAVEVIDAFRAARLLVPLVANLGEAGEGVEGLAADKSAELSIVTVEGPDGYNVLPVFTSVTAMTQWHPGARPVPSDATRVALAAASENTPRVVLDPGSDTEFAIRRPALEAIGKQEPWVPPHQDEQVLVEFSLALGKVDEVIDFVIEYADPKFLLHSAELMLTLRLAPGLDSEKLELTLKRVGEAIAASEIIAQKVDSLRLKLAQA